MSSIRLFILSSFDLLGPMHGHRLRLEAENRYVSLWTDISVGAVYGAMSRLAEEKLLRQISEERDGNRPVRQIYEITDEGRRVLADLRRAGLTDIWYKHDPFDLALIRLDPASAAELPRLLDIRLKALEAQLAEANRINDWAAPYIGITKRSALKHGQHRLRAEIGYLREVMADIDAIVAEVGAGKV
ncbi:PadR family transcriptional regulator [Rhizobium tumorigenes]|uniref:Helix-turn-helix transcriptional regulator n=1 Tax=Rhizobium tumorigenes TaxID=2041385 RepID=A0AAF1K4I8_9HYPH|nr:helix-turn-helix transcriptional regulator [Rhizobium tumorigenes]WFR95758.1 helix-turn-helix transcriptional regulator [Rhizobium tumorigenes]